MTAVFINYTHFFPARLTNNFFSRSDRDFISVYLLPWKLPRAFLLLSFIYKPNRYKMQNSAMLARIGNEELSSLAIAKPETVWSILAAVSIMNREKLSLRLT